MIPKMYKQWHSVTGQSAERIDEMRQDVEQQLLEKLKSQ